jgi:tRNA pseudouridine55 synthase
MADILRYKTIVLIDKPRGITSNATLGQIKKVIRSHLQCGSKELPKIGHGGTLDPEATGLLIIGITRDGTRELGTQIEADKIYECEVDLLKSSVTGDLELFEQMNLPDGIDIPTLAEIEELIATNFTGTVEQTPPIYSALKVGGKKACDLARAGKDVELKARNITLYSIKVIDYTFPVLTLRIHCSKGTYIRTVGQDIGKALGLYGTLCSLRRLQSGLFDIADAIKLDTLTFDDLIISD